MSWKNYSLGSFDSAQKIVTAALPKLIEVGYSATSDGLQLSIPINGVTYSGNVSEYSGSPYPVYLWVNSETNEIAICKHVPQYSSDGRANFATTLCFAVLHGTNILTGETGLFALTSTNGNAETFTNVWTANDTDDQILLHRAMFKKNSGKNETPFVSDLFWGSVRSTPGATVEAGGAIFVCLNNALYAKV